MDKCLRESSRDRWENKELGWRGYLRTEEGVLLEERVIKAMSLVPKLGKTASYLDIGCGDGFLTGKLAEKIGTGSVFGIDALNLAEAKSRKINAVRLDINDSDSLPFRGSSFDVITCLETLEHVLDTDALVSEIHRVLRKDGTAIISVPRLDSLFSILLLALGYQPPAVECSIRGRYGVVNEESRVSGHVSNFTRRALMEMLESRGFRIADYRESSIYSGWKLAMMSHGKAPSFIQKTLLWVLSKIPFKKDVAIVMAKKS